MVPGSPLQAATGPGRTASAVIFWMPKRAEGTSLSPRNSKALYREDLIGFSLSKKKYNSNFLFSEKKWEKVSKRQKEKVVICEVLAF